MIWGGVVNHLGASPFLLFPCFIIVYAQWARVIHYFHTRMTVSFQSAAAAWADTKYSLCSRIWMGGKTITRLALGNNGEFSKSIEVNLGAAQGAENLELYLCTVSILKKLFKISNLCNLNVLKNSNLHAF